MALQKFDPSGNGPSGSIRPSSFSCKVHERTRYVEPETRNTMEPDVDIDLREVYFLIMHFLSGGPCHRTYGQFWNELLEHQLLPRRYHAWYSRTGVHSGDEDDDGTSFPLSYNMLVERYPHIQKDHLVKLLKQLLDSTSNSRGTRGRFSPHAADVPTLLGEGSISLLSSDWGKGSSEVNWLPAHMRWPHIRADQVRGLALREIGGGFARHQRAPSIRAASYAIAKPSTMVQKMQNVKRIRGHRNAVYCATFDRSGRYVITGSDDRLVKIWAMETAYCLASCRGHDGDVTDLAVSSNNAMVASSSNDCIIRVWRLPDGLPISVLRGHTAAVTAIAFNPRPSSVYHLLSSADDGTCRIWDARNSQLAPRIYIPRPSDSAAGRNSGSSSNAIQENHQIFCCAFNANGTVFVTGSSDTYARVWNACKPNVNDSDQPIHEIDVLSGHGNDVNYVQFSGCAVAARYFTVDSPKDESTPKFKNTWWYSHENIVTCSRDGSAIIWIPRSRRSHGKFGRWTRAYHLKVPPPPMPPQPPRGGPRMRSVPTPRGVNMIMWSLDNRFVLAAIMDCRICVWNASDGSLVHSLAGHTESTYVLDVHPFNPRIAMSAGYDGKTIVWDIWEGVPIKTYEISHFKLVDGKFSPDGTSITLSDDVGQLYILSTGQGESQKDAKYDQFFLGDYRPLIQDSYGNVLDQESQLAPYRRNMQDLLCDSAMIPYEEPYQSMYQQRRLGTLGIEWRPSSLRFAVGPDFNLDEDHHILPLADLDALIDPLPEFVDVIDWEPENDVQSDENDSEYNIAEEFSIEEEQGSLSSNSYGDSDFREEDSEDEETNIDGLRRSKRKNERADIEIMTSSGRRVKRRYMDEGEGSSLRSIQNRKPRNVRKGQKSSKSKSVRPRRAAARNALSLFSKISGTSDGEEEDEDSSEGDTSRSESMPQDLNIESGDSDKYLENKQYKNPKGKEVVLDETDDAGESSEPIQSHLNAGNKRKLLLKLPVRASTKLRPSDNATHNNDKGKEITGSSSKCSLQGSETSEDHQRSLHSGNSSSDINSSLMGTGNGKSVKVEYFAGLSDKCRNANLNWGGFKARTVKRARSGETKVVNSLDISNICHDTQEEMKSCSKGSQNVNNDCSMVSHVEIKTNGDNMDGSGLMNDEFIEDGTPRGYDVADTSVAEVKSVPGECRVQGDSVKLVEVDSVKLVERTVNDTAASSANSEGRIDHLSELKKSPAPMLMKFKIPSKSTSRDSSSPSKLKQLSFMENQRKKECIDESGSEQKASSGDPLCHEIDKASTDHGDNISQDLDGKITGESHPAIDEAPEAHQKPKKMYTAVYKRSKTHRGRSRLEGDSANMGGETSKATNSNVITAGNTHRDLFKGDGETTSNGPNLARGDLNSLKDLEQQEELENTRGCAPTTSRSRRRLQHEGGPSSRLAVGFRSTRNRRVSCYVRDRSPLGNKVCYSGKRSSWLMLSVHEEGFLYVPQKGDEVVYLRQGHEGYIDHTHSREEGPWTSLKEDIRAVEFCKVEDLEYSTLPGSGDSCCEIKLKFIDPNSRVFDQSFNLILPEVTTFPDFLVERSRFDAAMQKKWACRDKCEVWWKNDSQGGDWWSGRIKAVKPISPDFPDSPWERYSILYSNYSNPTELCLHSPWELRDADHHWVQPHMEEESRNRVLAAFAKLDQSNGSQDRYGVQKLKQVSHKTNFINRFPVPLTLELIQSRLENNYYRSLDALKHDMSVVLANGESYFERNAEILHKFRRLREWFNRILSSL